MRSHWKIVAAVAVAVAAVVAAVVVGDPRLRAVDADALVREAARSLRQTPVRGELVTTLQTPAGPRELRAEVHRGEGRFIISYLSGALEGTRVHRQRGAVWVEGQEGRGPRRSDVGERELHSEMLRRNWSFSAIGSRRIAGRATTVVRGIGPGGTLTMALDRETAFPLQMIRRDPDGNVISESTWTAANFAVEVPPKIDPPERRDGRYRTVTTLDEARTAVDFAVLEPTWIPEGWELQDWYLHERPRNATGAAVEAHYTDGLRSLIIIQRRAREMPERGPRPDGVEREPRQDRPGRGERGERQWREGAPDRPDGPPRADGQDRPARPEGEGGSRHMRGFAGDASRRAFDETVVIVIGPLSEQQRERILDGMQPAS